MQAERKITIPELSIIIVNWNAREILLECLKTIYQTVTAAFEVIVVDNNSADESVAAIRQAFPGVVVSAQTENLGFSKGNNVGAGLSQGEYFLILNPDILLEPNVIDNMLVFLKNHPDIGILGPRILNKDRTVSLTNKGKLPSLFGDFKKLFLLKKIEDIVQRFLIRKVAFFRQRSVRHLQTSGECEFLQGSCLLLRRDVYVRLKGLDEAVPMFLDDVDLCYRVRKAGLKVYYFGAGEIIHYHQYSTKKAKDYKLYDVLSLKARLFYYEKHYGALVSGLFRLMIVASVPYLLLIDIACFPFYLVQGRAAERGLVFKKHFYYLVLAFFNKTGVFVR